MDFDNFSFEALQKMDYNANNTFYLLYSVVIKRFKVCFNHCGVFFFWLRCRQWPAYIYVLAIRKTVRYRYFRLRHKYICGDLSSGKKLTGKWFIRHWPADLCDRQTVWSLDYKCDMTAQADSYKIQSDPNLEYSDLNLRNEATFLQRI